MATQQQVYEVVNGVLGLQSQAPLRIHAEGEEEDAAVLVLFRVVRSLGCIGIHDGLVDILSPVAGAAGVDDEDFAGKRRPVVVPYDIPRPVVAG